MGDRRMIEPAKDGQVTQNQLQQEPVSEPAISNQQQQEPQEPATKDDNIVITKAEYEAKLAQARKDEKDKLYKTYAQIKEELRIKNEELAKFKAAEEEAAKKAEEERLAKLTEQERMREEINKASARVEQLTSAFTSLQKETEEKLKLKELELLKERLISEARGQLIPELVSGNSEEELLQSVEKAKQRYLQLREDIVKDVEKLKTKPIEPSTIATETPQTRITPPQTTQQQPTAKDIFSMTPEEFKQYKEKELNAFGL